MPERPGPNPLDTLASLRLEDGSAWGERAADFQWADARAFLAEDGPRFHWHGRPRGGSKTTDAAALAAVQLLTLPGHARLYAAASDRSQARLLVDALDGLVRRSPALRRRLKVDLWRVTAESGASLEVLAADGPGVWGLKPHGIFVDELTAWAETRTAKAIWEGLSSSLGKVPGARALVISTSGDPAHWSRREFDFAQRSPLWRVSETKGPVPWADPVFLEQERLRLPESRYRQLHLNEWVASEDRLTNTDDLAACVQLSGPLPPEHGKRYAIGLDLGLVHDRTAAAIVHADRVTREIPEASFRTFSGGELREETIGHRLTLDKLEIWQGRPGKAVELRDVEDWIVQASASYNKAPVRLDPWQAVGLAQRLRDRGVRVEEFSFSSASVGRLATTLHVLLRNRLLVLPDDPELYEELSSVRLRETSPGVLRMDHDAGRHDDRAVALALGATYLLERARGSARVQVGPSIYG